MATIPQNPTSFNFHIATTNPSGAVPQPGPNDATTAILWPKKLLVNFAAPLFRPVFLMIFVDLTVDEATSDDNSGGSGLILKCCMPLTDET